MRLTHLYRESDMNDIKSLYEEAFPPEEKKPFSLILEKNNAGSMEILALEGDDGAFLGLAILILHQDLALLDYLAIAPHRRGGGIGTQALALLRERYAGKRFLLEIEDADEAGASNRADRIRRRAFYLRNGLCEMPYRVLLFGVQMRILTDGSPISFDEYHAIFPAVFSAKAAANVIEVNDDH
ncbi:MAG: GNAT family N-acetyltransferase [Clostridia bacterium]|nr:GNAT family N-acetyltransferase [Clostridia bacterium]